MNPDKSADLLSESSAVDETQPWPGLESFREVDQRFFHGRDAEAEELERLVLRSRLTLLYGISGLGKTSLLCAGLFHRLRLQLQFPVYCRLNHVEEALPLAEQLRQAIIAAADDWRVELPAFAEPTLWEDFHRYDSEFWSARNDLLTPVLVLDQFEELFTLGRCSSEARRRGEVFLEELADLVEGRPPVGLVQRLEAEPSLAKNLDFSRHDYKVVLSMREEFLAEIDSLRELMPSIAHNRFRLLRMDGVRAMEAVVRTGRGLIRPDIASEVVRFVAAKEDEKAELADLEVEPALLSVVCRELNKKRLSQRRSQITADLLEGSREEILNDFYEQSLEGLPVEVRVFVEDKLLTVSGFRDSVAWDNALQAPGVAEEDLRELVRRRLLRIEQSERGARIELTHDLLSGVVAASRSRRHEAERRRQQEILERRQLTEKRRRARRWTQELPAWNDETSVAELKDALQERRFKDAEVWIQALVADLDKRPRRLDTRTATRILVMLRAQAWFEKLYQVAEKLESLGQDDVEVRRQLVQARIEQGFVTTAIGELLKLKFAVEEELQDEDQVPPERERLKWELGEIFGLLGRCYKQLYLEARPTRAEPRRMDLSRALEFYGESHVLGLGAYMWHGVNYVALLTHARRIETGKRSAVSKKALEQADKILAAIDAKERAGTLQVWDLSNRAECFLARGENRKAVVECERYLKESFIAPFHIRSYRRQLKQLWMLTEEDYPGSVILPMMSARIAELGPGEEEIELTPSDAIKYERVLGETGYQPLAWLLAAVERSRCVARLGPDKFEGWGTSFLFDGAWISEQYRGRHLLLGNSHIVSDDPAVQAQTPHPRGPEELTAVFLGPLSVEVEILAVIWSSPPSDLDATLMEIDAPPEDAVPPPLAPTLPETEGQAARLNIIGHPRDFDVRVSMGDSICENFGDPFIHYKRPATTGVSGSLVFNQQLELVAVQHAFLGSKNVEEGIRMDRLIEAMRKDLL